MSKQSQQENLPYSDLCVPVVCIPQTASRHLMMQEDARSVVRYIIFRSSVSLTMAYNHRFCRYVPYITCSDKHVIGMVYAVKVCSDTMRLRVSISESLAKRVNCLDTRLAGNKNRLEDDSHPWPFDLCRNRNVVSCTETPNLCDSELHKHLQRNSKNADTLWNGACCRITLVSDSQCAFGKAIAWMRAWVSGCAGVCLLPMFVYYCKSHVVSSIRGPLTPPAHQPLLLALGRPLLSTTWNHERSMSFLVSFRSCLTAVLSHLKSQPRRFSAMTPVTKFISDMLETQMNTSAANLCQLRVR